MRNLEGNVHAQLGGVAAVEGLCAFLAVDCADAVQNSSVGTVVHLEALLDH